MAGKLKHMDRAQITKLRSQARKPQSILSKALGGLRKVQDK